MSGKIQFTKELNWVTSTPVPFVSNTAWSGVTAVPVSHSDVVYTNIIDVTIKDNNGLEVSWTGNMVGTIEIMASNSGKAFYALTFNPVLAQPAGSASGYLIDLNQFPFKFLMIKYTNTMGSGTISAYLCSKDLN